MLALPKMLVAMLWTCLLATPVKADQVILAGDVIDGVQGESLGPHTLRVRDGVIVAIEAGLLPAAAGGLLRKIDFVMKGGVVYAAP